MSKLRNIVHLYLNPPAEAPVLSVVEKSQIQALDCTQPMVPACQTHDYERHGMMTLCAAPNILEGHVIERCQSRHTHPEIMGFLGTIDRQPLRCQDIHLILDNYGTHKHPTMKRRGSRSTGGLMSTSPRPGPPG